MRGRENGVSEVIGTLLILAITVALFATVFTFVNTMPRATSDVQVTFYPEYNPEYNGHSNFYLNLTLVSGTPLRTSGIVCVLIVPGNSPKNTFSSANPNSGWVIPKGNYIYPGNGPSSTIYFRVTQSLPSGNYYAYIYYKYTNQILWQMSFYIPPS